MIYLVRIWIFSLCFFIQISVKAKSVKSSDSPIECSKKIEYKGKECTVRSYEPFAWQVDGHDVYLAGGSTVTYLGKGKFNFVRGKMWLKSTDAISVETPYGSASVSAGEFYTTRMRSSRWDIKALKQPVTIKAKGSEDEIKLMAGFHIWLGRVTENGVARTSIPRVIFMKDHLKEWIKFYPARKENFGEDLRSLGYVVNYATTQLSDFYSYLYHRRVASLKSAHRKKVQAKRRKIDYSNSLIKLFRKKSNFDY